MKEGSIPDQGFDISPSNKDNTERRSLSLTKKIIGPLIKHPVAFAEAFLAIAGGGYGAYTGIDHLNDKDNSPPSIHEPVDPALSADTDRLEGLPSHLEQPKPQQSVSEWEKKINPKEVFDNEATKGVITPAMREKFSKERIKHLDSFARLADQKTEIVTVPKELQAKYGSVKTQFVVGEDKNTIEILPTVLDLSQTSKSNMDIEIVGTGFSPGGVEWELFGDKGYIQHYELRMKDGSKIPKGAFIKMFLLNEDGGYLLQAIGGEGKKDALIDIQAPNGDISRFKVIASNGEGKNTEFVSLEPLVPAPDFSEVLRGVRARQARYNITLGYNVVGDQPILQLSGNAERITINLMTSVKGEKGETLWPSGVPTFVLANLAMFSPESSSNNTE